MRAGYSFSMVALLVGVSQPAVAVDPKVAGGAPSATAPSPSPTRRDAVAWVERTELRDALRRLDSAPGPTQLTELRKLWALWDRVEPAAIEAALLTLSNSRGLTVPARSYAGYLSALARSRRGDFTAAREQVLGLGFVKDWLVVGPFDNEGKVGLAQSFAPEQEFGEAIMPARSYTGKERQVRWRQVPEVFPYGFLDLGSMMRPQKKICAFATTFVRARPGTPETRRFSAWLGSTGAAKLYFNGSEVLSDESYRRLDPDRQAVTLKLTPGYNDLTVKICGDELPPALTLRLADAQGAPDPNLETRADFETSSAARSKRAKAPLATSTLLGPIQTFEALTSGKAPNATALAAYADYLRVTEGDDPARHQARDLAVRAAEASPTIEHLLLAAQFAEDRNQRARWVERAEAVAAQHKLRSIPVMLARASLERSSSNPKQALRHYDAVLQIDPDEPTALVERAELYTSVGLQRTALASLAQGMERSPGSLRLLIASRQRLRDLGRAIEATELERRYAGQRFDDGGLLGRMIELSLARRDKASAERWAERVLEVSPYGQWSLGLAARTYQALGQRERAAEAYERALAIAPEDVGTMRALSDLRGELGDRTRQIALLRRVLEVTPQDKDTRDYLEHLEPAKAPADEQYAWTNERFLALRHAPANGQNQRTLRDLTVTTVFQNGLSSTFRQVVFQPLTDSAAAVSRQFGFAYESDRQTVQLRGARVYRADGRTDEAVESGEAPANNPAISTYTSARTFYVQFPRLEPGDVVELRYRLEDSTPRNEFADYFGDVVYLQSDQPVQNAEYVLITPKSRKMLFDSNLGAQLTSEVVERGDERIHRFVAANLAPIEPEPLMPPFTELVGFVHASTFESWQAMGRWYWGFVKDQFDIDEETRKLARRITVHSKTDEDKVRAVYDWVIENTRYVALEFGVYGYKPHRAVQTVTRGWGDCKDKATAIVTLLRTLGIDAKLVVLRTQMRGAFASKIASLAPFDHAIAYVPSMDLYLDGTAEGTGSRELPAMDRGAVALLIDEAKTELVRLPEHGKAEDRVLRNVTLELSADGGAAVELRTEVSGVTAPDWRNRFEAESTRRERVGAELSREFTGLNLLPGTAGLTAHGLSEVEQDVAIEARGRSPQLGRQEGDGLSLAVTPDLRLVPQYASLSTRKYDVRILAFPRREDHFTAKLPAGFHVVSAPPKASGTSRFGSYSVEVELTAGKVVVHTRLELTVSRVTAADYPEFRKFCAEVDRALGPRLVIAR